ncbi:phage tail protein [Lacticaseibacillus pantheris]
MIALSAFHLFILDKLTVQGLGSAYREPLASVKPDTFNIQWQKNSTWQLEFTAIADGSVAYSMLDTLSSVYFAGQQYVIAQVVPDFSQGLASVQVTATHIYTQVSRVRQYNTRTGTMTYQPKDVLAYYLDGNSLGYTYDVQGTFDNQQITDLGNGSGSDMLSKIVETWPEAVIYPDNKKIVVYSAAAWQKDLGGRIDYLHNTIEVQLTSDATEMVNQLQVTGASKDTGDSDTTEYYFQPHLVTDNDSVAKWGLWPGDPLEDDRFTSASAMDAYAITQMSPEPALSIDVTLDSNEQPTAGEMRRLHIKDNDYTTTVEVVAYTWYPWSKATQTAITLNNTTQNILDYQAARKAQLNNSIQAEINNLSVKIRSVAGTSIADWTDEEVTEFGSKLNNS